MDSNNSQRPRKRISKETARKRQLAALFAIAFLVLIFIILIAKGCSKDKSKGSSKSSDTKPKTTTVTTTAPLDQPITTVPPSTEPPTAPVNTSGFKLDRYSVYLNVGQSEMPLVKEYPAGSSEADEKWSSDNESIATVDWQGNITAVAPGICYITLKSAADETQEVQIKVTVADSSTNTATTEPTTTAVQDQPVY